MQVSLNELQTERLVEVLTYILHHERSHFEEYLDDVANDPSKHIYRRTLELVISDPDLCDQISPTIDLRQP